MFTSEENKKFLYVLLSKQVFHDIWCSTIQQW